MIHAYRLAHRQFISDLAGTGAAMYGGRWNMVDKPCLYCSQHLSLAVLEKLAHAQKASDLVRLALLHLTIEDPDWLYWIEPGKLKRNWRTQESYTQWLGSQILDETGYVGFVAPSVIIETEFNIVLNPKSELFAKLKVDTPIAFELDKRITGKWI